MTVRILQGDCRDVLKTLEPGSVQCCVTSPPYFGLRDYGLAEQIGLEESPDAFVAALVGVFREVRRVLRDDGTLWLNLGSSYAGGGMGGGGSFATDRPGWRVAADASGRIQSRRPARALACGSGGRELAGSLAIDSSCRDLCDGCRDALQSPHIQSSGQSSQQCEPPHEPIDRGISNPGSAGAFPDAALHGAPGSTKPQSSTPPPGSCSHCDNCGACLSVLRSASRDAQLCARKASCIDGTPSPSSGHHNQGKDVLGTACFNYKPKDLIPIPWLVALALQADGWYLRQDIIWHKPNPMPESVRDRCTKAHEYVFLLSKSERYHFDARAIAENCAYPAGPGNVEPMDDVPGLAAHNNRSGLHHIGPRDTRNRRSVWTIPTKPYAEAHFAAMAPDLARDCVLAGCPEGGIVLDPFGGAGTTGLVADRLQRNAVLIELNPAYADLARARIAGDAPLFAEVA